MVSTNVFILSMHCVCVLYRYFWVPSKEPTPGRRCCQTMVADAKLRSRCTFCALLQTYDTNNIVSHYERKQKPCNSSAHTNTRKYDKSCTINLWGEICLRMSMCVSISPLAAFHIFEKAILEQHSACLLLSKNEYTHTQTHIWCILDSAWIRVCVWYSTKHMHGMRGILLQSHFTSSLDSSIRNGAISKNPPRPPAPCLSFSLFVFTI